MIYFKKELQIWDFESYIFWSKFCFFGTALGLLSILRCRSIMVADIFTQHPTLTSHFYLKKAPYSPGLTQKIEFQSGEL